MEYDVARIRLLQNTLEYLSRGIDPTSGLEFKNDTLLSSKLLKSYFAQTAELLGIVAENTEWVKHKKIGNTKMIFHLNEDEIDSNAISKDPISVSRLVYIINSFVKSQYMRRLKATQVTLWLQKNGFFDICENEFGESYKVANDAGKILGIETEIKINSRNETYAMNLYNQEAQAYVIKNINQIALI